MIWLLLELLVHVILSKAVNLPKQQYLTFPQNQYTVLPEQQQLTFSRCYGNHHFRPSCPQNNTVIAVTAVSVGAKRSSDLCPPFVSSNDSNYQFYNGTPVNSSCCELNNSTDCIFNYNTGMLNYSFHTACSGYQACTRDYPVVNNITYGACNQSVFMNHSNYMFMEYSCIDNSRIGDICSNNTYHVVGSPFYLQSPGYPLPNFSANRRSCICQINNDTKSINIYTLDIRLSMSAGICTQRLQLFGEDSLMWDCDNQTAFKITHSTSAGPLYVQLANDIPFDGGYIWVGFQADELVIDCSITNIPNRPTTATTSGSATTVSTTRTSATSCPPSPPPLGMIVGIVVEAISIILLLVLLVLCVIKKKNRKVRPENDEICPNNTSNETVIQEQQEAGQKDSFKTDDVHPLIPDEDLMCRKGITETFTIPTPFHETNGLPPLQTRMLDKEPERKKKRKKRKKKTIQEHTVEFPDTNIENETAIA